MLGFLPGRPMSVFQALYYLSVLSPPTPLFSFFPSTLCLCHSLLHHRLPEDVL